MQTTVMVGAPLRTLDQRAEALVRANEVRFYRAQLKAAWRAGKVGGRDAVAVLLEPTELEETWKVYKLLVAIPKVGRVKADKVLRRAGVSPAKTVGGLTSRQREELLRVLPSRCGGTVRG